MDGLDAWSELTEKYFSEDDQAQLEWAIGCVLSGGPKKILVIQGPAASGKSTVLKLVQNLVEDYQGDRLRISVRHDGMRGGLDDAFMFVASNVPVQVHDPSLLIQIKTTGAVHSEKKRLLLAGLIDQDHRSIIDHCVSIYQENNQ